MFRWLIWASQETACRLILPFCVFCVDVLSRSSIVMFICAAYAADSGGQRQRVAIARLNALNMCRLCG